MKVLITGGAGYIGSHVVKCFSHAGHEVSVIDNLSTGRPEALLNDEKLYQFDLANTESLNNCMAQLKPDIVLHFAASIRVDESVLDPLKYYINNTVNATNLIKCCHDHKVNKLIFSSTAAVYGIPPAPGVAKEDTPLMPINPYGRSKAVVEGVLSDLSIASAGEFSYASLRYFNVAGADPNARIGQVSSNATHLIKVCAQVVTGQREELIVNGADYSTPDGTCIRDYIHVEDLANAHLLAAEFLHEGGVSNIFNVGYGCGFSVRQVIEAVEKVSNRKLRAKDGPRRPGDPPILIADASKIRRELNWSPQYADLDAIIRHALAWEEKLISLKPSI